jgi:hypothetical protein
MSRNEKLRLERNAQWATLGQEELHEINDFWCSLPEDDPANIEPAKLTWRYEPEFETAKLGPCQEWAEWLHAERAMCYSDLGYDRCASIARWWPSDPEEEPVVVVRALDGTYHLWDGAHRTAISALFDWPTLPAFVGEIDTELIPK